MVINICGIPHTVKYTDDNFPTEQHFGCIEYAKAEIHINKNATEDIQREALFHEVLHGVFVHIGRDDLSNDEVLMQSLANALLSVFDIKKSGE